MGPVVGTVGGDDVVGVCEVGFVEGAVWGVEVGALVGWPEVVVEVQPAIRAVTSANAAIRPLRRMAQSFP